MSGGADAPLRPDGAGTPQAKLTLGQLLILLGVPGGGLVGTAVWERDRSAEDMRQVEGEIQQLRSRVRTLESTVAREAGIKQELSKQIDRLVDAISRGVSIGPRDNR